MTGIPCSRALAIDAAMPVPFCARTMRTVAPPSIRASTSLACVSSDDWASAETYLAPAAVTAFRIAGPSHVPKRPDPLLHETPTTHPPGDATGPSLPPGPPAWRLVGGALAAPGPVAHAPTAIA